MPLVRPAPLSAWMLAGIDRRVAPAVGDQLLGRGRIAAGGAAAAGARRRGRARRRRRAPAPGMPRRRRTSSSPAPALRVGRRDERHLDVDRDRRDTTSCRRARRAACRSTGTSADRRRSRSASPSTSPSARSSARGRAPRARSPRRSPAAAASTTCRRVVTLRAVLQRQDVGQVRIRIGLRLVVVGVIRRRLVAARPGPQRLDAELLHHLPMILLGRLRGFSRGRGLRRGRGRRLRRLRRRRLRRLGSRLLRKTQDNERCDRESHHDDVVHVRAEEPPDGWCEADPIPYGTGFNNGGLPVPRGPDPRKP